MSVLPRTGARLISVEELRRVPAATHKTALLRKNISWMAFEQPNPALYPPPSTLQPKRPEAASGADPTTMVGRIGAAPSTVRIPQEPPTPGKTMPASVPASAMRTGPTPLSQTQKRAATTTSTANATTITITTTSTT
ncbi:hypothetical protein F5Y14DRAFT_455476 [Nemania sp. NC0429]|nr:hypothetical protein F5Y14DRAFT_455476 [Nemania sp. NC0429]